jgi:arylsulfatase A-like enzyme
MILAAATLLSLLGESAVAQTGDSTIEALVVAQKKRAETKGWKFDQSKVEAMFSVIDADGDGVASGVEKKAYWANRKKASQGNSAVKNSDAKKPQPPKKQKASVESKGSSDGNPAPAKPGEKTKSISGSKGGRPNILLIFCDDLGYADVGFNAKHFGVETDVKTPVLDKLARQGTIFSQAYVCHPFCGPSRMGLFAGRMPHCFGGQKNLPDVARNVQDYNSKGIPVSETLVSKVLQKANYRTGIVGKWHMGDAKPFQPNSRGFDEFYGFLGGGHHYFPSITDKVKKKVNDYQYFLKRNDKEIMSPEGAYLTDTLSEEAAKFISKIAKGEDPFFLYLAYNAPHSPLHGKLEDLQKLYPDHQPKNPKNGVNYQDYEKRQNYVAMMYAVDRGVAQVVQTLKDPNQDGDQADSMIDNTLIVFLSDNGGKILQAGNNAPLQDDKGSTHEGGIRVPMFMHWPGKVPAESVFEHPVTALDFYPTFAGLAEAEIPAGKKLDGKDIWEDFIAGRNPHVDETMFWLRHHGGGNEVAVRQGNLKAYRINGGKWQVFNVAKDVGEANDLAKANRGFLEDRVSEGAKWSKTLEDLQWHDTQKAFETWEQNRMPKYEQTFKLRK